MPTPTLDIYDDDCDEPESVVPLLLATGSAVVLGYLLGRVSYSRDLDSAIRRAQESPDPVTLYLRTL